MFRIGSVLHRSGHLRVPNIAAVRPAGMLEIGRTDTSVVVRNHMNFNQNFSAGRYTPKGFGGAPGGGATPMASSGVTARVFSTSYSNGRCTTTVSVATK